MSNAVLADSKVNTLDVPIVGTNPATLTYATNVPMRVVVQNNGNTPLLIAYDSNTLKQKPPVVGNTFRLPTGTSQVFVLAPKQGIFAASVGGTGQVSIATSEAFPTFLMES